MKCVDGDLTFCRITSKGSPEMDLKAWEVLYDEHIKLNGLGKLKKKLLNVMIKKAHAELDFVITGDRFKLTEIEIEESKLQALLDNSGTGMTINQTLIHLSKWIGHWLNDKQLMTQEYFDLIKEFEKYNKPNSTEKKEKKHG